MITYSIFIEWHRYKMKKLLNSIKRHFYPELQIEEALTRESTINNMLLLAKKSQNLTNYVKRFRANEISDDQFIAACTIILSKELLSLRDEKEKVENQNW